MNKTILIFILGLFLSICAKATVYTVNNPSDLSSGAGTSGTLRWCIGQANIAAGKDTINFGLTGGGPYTLLVGSAFAVNFPVFINGFSQAGSFQGQLGFSTRVMQIILNGPGNNIAVGFQFSAAASNSEIAGLVIQNFYRGIYFNGCSNSWIWGCYIGTTSTGLTATPATTCFDDGIYLGANANNNFIGTNGNGINDANEGNCIGGNGDGGIQFYGECIAINEGGSLATNCSGNRISGNFLGINESGLTALYTNLTANLQRGSGIHIVNSTLNIIGTNADGTSDVLERNVISGNSDAGVVLQGSSNNRIKGNYIGTNRTGTGGVPNYGQGGTGQTTSQVVIKLSSTNNFIGTDGDGSRDNIEGNVIGSAPIAGGAGSYSDGIDIISSSTGNRVSGNYIGIGWDGLIVLNILSTGTTIGDNDIYVSAANNIIGTNGDGLSDAYESNYLGNSGTGVYIDGVSGTIVAGNYFGLGINFTTPEPFVQAAVYIYNGTANRIGSTASNILERNYCCNSTKVGIWLDGATTANNDLNNIRYNAVGVRPDGGAASNTQNGIKVEGNSNADTLQYNIIAYNGTGSVSGAYAGIQIGSSVSLYESKNGVINNNTIYKNLGPGINMINSASINNKITQNNIYNNGNAGDATGKLKLGIDLNNDGPTLNDNFDPDTGPNTLSNFPVITAAIKGGISCSQNVTGTFNGLANTPYFIEVFSSDVCNGDTAGVDYYTNTSYNFGEGKTYEGASAAFTTDGSGNANWSAAIFIGATTGQYITAVAIQNTAGAYHTSEFSKCYTVKSDFGDAPDTYHTLLANCGAVHGSANASLLIGTSLTYEDDGQPSVLANLDSDDGLSSIPTLSVLSTTYTLSAIPVANASGSTATLYGWIDFNRNGSFESTEFTSATVASGATSAALSWNLSSFNCGTTLVSGISYLRLRLTTNNLTDNGATSNVDERSYGIATDGEVEDYKVYISGIDYGDLNASYPVAKAICFEDTAIAKVWAGITKPSLECTQKFSVDAYGDGPEEDGLLTSGGPTGSSYTWVVKLNSNQASKVVYYGLWIDWDANSNFTSAMDGFYSGSVVTNGPTTTSVSVYFPAGLSMSSNFRLVASVSPVTSGMYNATFTNGEVEDYSLVTILSSPTILLTASKWNNGNILRWKNDFGVAIDNYIIERSSDNITWDQIGIVTPLINDDRSKQYSFIDANTKYEKNYYRLKISYPINIPRYSNVVMLSDKNKASLVTIFPNPAADIIHVLINNSNFKRIEIFDLAGKKEMNQTLIGVNNTIDISRLSKGTHIVKLIANNGNEEIKRFIKL